MLHSHIREPRGLKLAVFREAALDARASFQLWVAGAITKVAILQLAEKVDCGTFPQLHIARSDAIVNHMIGHIGQMLSNTSADSHEP